MFAVERRPVLEPGELQLLQLTKADAEAAGKLHHRVEHVLVFDRIAPDPDGFIEPRQLAGRRPHMVVDSVWPTARWMPSRSSSRPFGGVDADARSWEENN